MLGVMYNCFYQHMFIVIVITLHDEACYLYDVFRVRVLSFKKEVTGEDVGILRNVIPTDNLERGGNSKRIAPHSNENIVSPARLANQGIVCGFCIVRTRWIRTESSQYRVFN